MQKKRAKHLDSNSGLSPEDQERIRRAFRITLRRIEKLRESQVLLLGYLRELRKRVRRLEKQVSGFITPN